MITDFAIVREGRPADAAELAALFAETWLVAYAGIIPMTTLRAHVARRGAAWWQRELRGSSRPLVLVAGGKLAGYATCGPSRGAHDHEGEIYELYVTPTHQGLGLGEHLFEAARARLDQANLNGLIVWALSENRLACEFYGRRGGRAVASTVECFGPARLDKTAFVWS